jgi:hypothetical protein
VANSQVDYGTATTYGTSTPVNQTMVTSHHTGLAGLSAGTVYHYRVRSTDGNGNTVVSTDATFTTGSAAGSGSGDTTPPTVSVTAPANGATVSGTVSVAANASDNVGVVSVQFQIDGANAGAAETASPYALSWDTAKTPNGTHTLTALAIDAAGNAATSAAVVVTVKNVTPTFSISGTIDPAAAGSGATVTLSGTTSATTTASNSGAYTFSGLANGTYAVTPSHAGDTFSPGSQSVTVSQANVTGVNFTGAAQTFSISGTISPTAGGSGATVTLSGAANATTTASSSGAYSFTGLGNGTYTVTPSHTGFGFTPGSQSATVSGASVSGLNFAATAQPGPVFSISGTISPATGGNGATITLSGTANATTTANSAGAYTFTGLANGTYTVSPSHAGFTFNPASQNATISGANITGLNFAATAQAGPTFSISGTISPGVGGNGATVTLGGAANVTTTANGSGAYTFAGLSNGAYTITPSDSGFTFSPVSQNATIAGANVTGVNFTDTAQTFSISGTISPTAAGNGATVTLSGAAGATTTASSSGAYTFSGLPNGTYTLTASHADFTFSPGSQNATIGGSNLTGVNFTGTASTFSISGTISPTAGGGGATVTLGGAVSATTTANGSGAYTFTGLANGTYTVTPSHAGFTFNPANASATIAGANVTGVNFTGTAQTFSISGTISPTAGGGGATVTLSGAVSATTTANGSGAYTFTGLTNGAYAVTPSNPGFAFSPIAQAATINGANATGLNFTATAQTPHSVSLSWTASVSTVTGYNVYRSTVSGGAYIKLNSSLITGLKYTDTTVESGTTYFYVATAEDASGIESTDSNQTTAAIP